MSTSIFSQIVSGLIPCYKVAEDDNHLAFLDISLIRNLSESIAVIALANAI